MLEMKKKKEKRKKIQETKSDFGIWLKYKNNYYLIHLNILSFLFNVNASCIHRNTE